MVSAKDRILNVQTERIDNHKAQFTVEIEAQQLDEAKRKAAKRIAKQVRIKGFRKGKAPYRIIAQYVGEAAILEEAVELLGNDVYKYALEESEVEPYGPGSLDDFKIDPSPIFIFSVPLQPEVDLKDYADIRVDFEEPEVTDEDVENALQQLRQQEAEVSEEEFETVEAGHRITVDLHSEFSDGEEQDDDDEDDESDSDAETEDATESDSDDEDESGDDAPYIPFKGDNFLHRHDLQLTLDAENEPILPGFIEAMVGANLDDEVVFELTVPNEGEQYKDIEGRKVEFHVTVKSIVAVTLPDLDDDFAKQVTEADGDEALDLAGLRTRTLEDLKKDALENAKSQYAESVLEKVIEQAEISYPDMMLEERIEDMLRDLDGQLQQQGMNLENYMRITGTSKESLQEQYRDNAADSVKRTLVLRELVQAQNVEMGDEQIEKRLNNMLMQFGAQGDQFRSLIDTPQMRENILNELLTDNIMTRIVAIGRGEDPEEAVKAREAEQDEAAEKARENVAKMMAAQEAAQAEVEAAEDSDEEDTVGDAEVETDDSVETEDASEEESESSVAEAPVAEIDDASEIDD